MRREVSIHALLNQRDIYQGVRAHKCLSVKRRLVSSVLSGACLFSLGTPTPRSEFFSPLCSRSLSGDYSDARRIIGFGGGRRYSFAGALWAKPFVALVRPCSELAELNASTSTMAATSLA